MAKVLTLEEALEEIKAKENDKGEIIINRFNKKKFETLMLAMLNDIDYTAENVKIKAGQPSMEEVKVTKGFRKFCRKLLESAGIDKLEAGRIETDKFIISSVDGLYDFFTEAMYLYMDNGNQFDLPNKKDFRGGIRLVKVPERKKIYNSRDLSGSGKVLGKVERKTKEHKKLKVKSTAPTYLSEKRLIK